MPKKKKFRFKRFHFHPLTAFIFMTIGIMVLSSILQLFKVQITYSTINKSGELENTIVAVKGMFSGYGFRYLISEALRNFATFTPLSTLLVALLGLSVAHASGLIDAFIKRGTLRVNNKVITFGIIFLATFSSAINEVGYVILIPFAALVYLANGRNPLLGITTAFCGVAFGYGATLFAGSSEIALVPITEIAARVVDGNFHVSMLSNLFAIIFSTIVISCVGTYVIENIMVKKIGRYKVSEEEKEEETKEIQLEAMEIEEQKRLERELGERKGLRYASIAFVIVLLVFAYLIIPGLPASGLLLDTTQNAYMYQLFSDNSYFQSGFTILVSIIFIATGIAYAIGAKTLKSDKDLIEKTTVYLKNIGYVIALIFFASNFIAIFKETNIGTLLVGLIANLLKDIQFTGFPLIIVVLLAIALSGLFITTQTAKWTILSPVVVPLMMQANISPQFTQFIFRAGDSMTKGMTPLLAYFVIYLAYLNIYNKDDEPITISKALSYVTPYSIIIGVTWIFIILFFYMLGLPIGPEVSVGL